MCPSLGMCEVSVAALGLRGCNLLACPSLARATMLAWTLEFSQRLSQQDFTCVA
ncbi:hypothetical protein [Blastopirellula marina]|uniref:hypothetical protein n=1 Tax=Blastopirellula marina TaxID=124 RepID=UPI001304F343|nr:hypothetical protein [Blastopirellula marina]